MSAAQSENPTSGNKTTLKPTWRDQIRFGIGAWRLLHTYCTSRMQIRSSLLACTQGWQSGVSLLDAEYSGSY